MGLWHMTFLRSSPSALAGRKVLIVEDEPLLAFDYSDELQEAGACPQIATSVAQADALIAARLPDLAVLDVNLGEETVWPVASLLTERGVPFLLVTGHALTANKLPSGVVPVDCLEKPVGAHVVVDRLATVLTN